MCCIPIESLSYTSYFTSSFPFSAVFPWLWLFSRYILFLVEYLFQIYYEGLHPHITVTCSPRFDLCLCFFSKINGRGLDLRDWEFGERDREDWREGEVAIGVSVSIYSFLSNSQNVSNVSIINLIFLDFIISGMHNILILE